MTTAQSPVAKLKAQADEIARRLKQGVRGELSSFPKKDRIKFGVVMDDKVLTVEMAWDAIVEADEGSLSEMILREMQEKRTDA